MNIAHQVWRVASEHQRVVAGTLLLAACLYLVPFVDRGWVPLDEGMTGQAAERVLRGQLPHSDYEEPYPGALSYIYAAVFRVAGIDTLHLRWAVFGAATCGVAVLYGICRRFQPPIMAAVTTIVSVVWTYPNYFSTLPSWWVLLCALACLWGIFRYVETGRTVFVVVAGLSAGVAFTFKQTGLYLLPPLVMSLMLCSRTGDIVPALRLNLEHGARAIIIILAVAFVLVVTWSGLGSGELLYLIVPIMASCAAFVLSNRWNGSQRAINWHAPLLAIACAAVPSLLLLVPQIAAGKVGSFLYGVFVLPQQRLQFTTLSMRPASQIVAAVAALMWLTWSPPALGPAQIRLINGLRWLAGIALVLLALRSPLAYAFIWAGICGTAALVPAIAAWLLIRRGVTDARMTVLLFASSGMAAWMSLSQFPFAAPIYFCYVAPLALVAGILVFRQAVPVRRLSDGPTIAVAALFALLSMNRGYVWNVGAFHEVQHLDTPLTLSRAHLHVAEDEAAVFNKLVPLVLQHAGSRGLVAGPDTPDVYFLTGQFSPSGRLFDFFSGQTGVTEDQRLAEWTRADVIVLFHGERFAPPLPESLVGRLRREFTQGESLPPFEVRWR